MQPDPAAHAADDGMIGRIIADRYRVVARLASGAMGEVYKAEQLALGRPVAIKLLRPRGIADEGAELRARFLREAAGLARLHHPNTVRILDFGFVDAPQPLEDEATAPAITTDAQRVPFLVMEFIEGETLRTLAKAGPMSPRRALRIALQVAYSLREAHQAGLLHRDLKPSNILVGLDADGHDLVKVVDFGLVKDIADQSDDDLTAVGLVVGTPLYLAPEIIHGRPPTPAADVWSIGVILYTLLAGKAPFPQWRDHARTMTAVVTQEPPPLRSFPHTADLPPSVEQLVDACLRKEPAVRLADGHQLVLALRVALRSIGLTEDGDERGAETSGANPADGVGSSTLRAPVPATEPEQPRRRWTPWVVALLALVAGALGLWWGSGSEGRNAHPPTTTAGSSPPAAALTPTAPPPPVAAPPPTVTPAPATPPPSAGPPPEPAPARAAAPRPAAAGRSGEPAPARSAAAPSAPTSTAPATRGDVPPPEAPAAPPPAPPPDRPPVPEAPEAPKRHDDLRNPFD